MISVFQQASIVRAAVVSRRQQSSLWQQFFGKRLGKSEKNLFGNNDRPSFHPETNMVQF
jgi:hypothetical protein